MANALITSPFALMLKGLQAYLRPAFSTPAAKPPKTASIPHWTEYLHSDDESDA